MSKGVKKVLGFVASIAIPFVAGPIAGALGMSGWLGSAAVGAGLGAANAALTGGNVAQGALFGGIGAGLNAGLSGAPMIGGGTGAGAGAGASAGGAGLNVGGTSPTLSGSMSSSGMIGQIGRELASKNPASLPGWPEPSFGEKFMAALAQTPTKIAEAVTNPEALADITLRAGAMLVSGAMTADPMAGLSDYERQLVEMRKDELQSIQQQNKQLFDLQLKTAQDLIGQANYFNPQYFAQEAAQAQQLRGEAMKKQAAENYAERFGQMRPEGLSAEERRINLGVSRNMAGAYGQGLLSGQNYQANLRQAGLNALPKTAPEGAAGQLLNMYEPYRQRADRLNEGLTQTFSDWTTRLTTPQFRRPPRRPTTGKNAPPSSEYAGLNVPSSIRSFG